MNDIIGKVFEFKRVTVLRHEVPVVVVEDGHIRITHRVVPEHDELIPVREIHADEPHAASPIIGSIDTDIGYIGDDITASEVDGCVVLTKERSDSTCISIMLDPLVLAHFLGWLENSEVFKTIPRGWSELLPNEVQKVED